MKHQAIVGNIGHFDNEIDMAGLARTAGHRAQQRSSRRSTSGSFADGHSIIVLSEGRLLNLGNATGHPSFVMSNSFANQTIAQIELFTKTDEYDKQVYVLPKHLDEKVARLHLDALGVQLTELTQGAGRVHRRRRRRPVQAGPLPLLGPHRSRRADATAPYPSGCGAVVYRDRSGSTRTGRAQRASRRRGRCRWRCRAACG